MPSFDLLNVPGFNPRNALLLVYAAKIAYEPTTVIREEVKQRWGLAQFQWFDKNDAQAFVAANDDNIIISFRGTQQDVLKDWLCDADFPFVKGPWGLVHQGFSRSLNYIRADLFWTATSRKWSIRKSIS